MSVVLLLACYVPARTQNVDLRSPSLQIHAKLPQNDAPGPKLSDVVTKAHGSADANGITSDGLNGMVFDEPNAANPSGGIDVTSLLKQRACSSDSIVWGHPNAWLYHLSSSGSAIYTDYDFVIDGVAKDNPASSVLHRLDVVVTRPGGSITVGQGSLKTISIENGAYPHLESSRQYLLFLRYISASGGYQTIDPFSTLVLSGTQWALSRIAYSKMQISNLSSTNFKNVLSGWLTSCQN